MDRFHKHPNLFFYCCCLSAVLCLFPEVVIAQSKQYYGDTPAISRPTIVNPLPKETSGFTVRDIARLRHSSESEKIESRRRQRVRGPLGAMTFFSPRTLQRHIDRDPRAIVVGAFGRAQRILQSNDFPTFLRGTKYDWQLFFESSKQHRGAGHLSSQRCHAAWMGPPANIFIAADRLASNCGTADRPPHKIASELHSVMVHEIGHAIEFQLMGKGFGRRQRWHSEGFASWFETLSDGKSTPNSRQEMYRAAQRSFSEDWRPVLFKGAKTDYARSFAMIATVAERTSILTLLKVYQEMDDTNCRFDQAVERVVGWDLARWTRETMAFLGSSGYGNGAYPAIGSGARHQ